MALLESKDGMVGGDCFCDLNFLCCSLGLTVAELVLFSPIMCRGAVKADVDFEVLALVFLSVEQESGLKWSFR